MLYVFEKSSSVGPKGSKPEVTNLEVRRKLTSFKIQEAASFFSKGSDWHWGQKEALLPVQKRKCLPKNSEERGIIFSFFISFPFFLSPLFSLSNISKFSIFFKVHVLYFLVTAPRSRSRRSSLVSEVWPACNLPGTCVHLADSTESRNLVFVLGESTRVSEVLVDLDCIFHLLSSKSLWGCRTRFRGSRAIRHLPCVRSPRVLEVLSPDRPPQLPPNQHEDDLGPCGSTWRSSAALLSWVQVVVDAYTMWRWSYTFNRPWIRCLCWRKNCWLDKGGLKEKGRIGPIQTHPKGVAAHWCT